MPIVKTIYSPVYFIYGYIQKCLLREYPEPLGSRFILDIVIYLANEFASANIITYWQLHQFLEMNL